MHTITKTVYTVKELEGNAQEKAFDWLREVNLDYGWWEFVYEDAIEIGKLMGLEIGTTRDGKERDLWFSGFSSQGDGACWGGRIDCNLFNGAVKRAKDYAPQDKELHRIAKACQSAYSEMIEGIRQHATRGEEDEAVSYLKDYLDPLVVTTNDRYKAQTVEGDTPSFDEEIFDGSADVVIDELIGAAQEIANDFAHWIYRRLEEEHDYQSSEEQLIDTAEANEYTFDAYGNREG